ncbi:MAG: ribosomal RNA small subunit methyltransferase A, partial [Pyrinomonadaceae bacterium]
MKQTFAKRSLGQNFLVDTVYIERIVAALDIQPGETIVEIGPGRGALTEKLVESPANIIALELDRNFVPLLRDRFIASQNFRIVEADALEIDLEKLIAEDPNSERHTPQTKLIANLPYYISTAILQKLIEQRHVFSSMVLMFQKEVVDRITSLPGNSDRGFLTV